eukprot:11812053-Alexandrium_andersonii.AAC.1
MTFDHMARGRSSNTALGTLLARSGDRREMQYSRRNLRSQSAVIRGESWTPFAVRRRAKNRA